MMYFIDTQDDPPFKEFQKTLSFLASIGLAASTTCAFNLVGATSLLGDNSDGAMLAVQKAALYLSWSSACFIVAIAVIVATQLLYTEKVIIGIITKEKQEQLNEKVVRLGVAVFAWTSLAFQTAAMFLFSQALGVISSGSMWMARYGVVGGMSLVAAVTLVGVLSREEGKAKMRGTFCMR
jgi:TctA family transporter